MQTKTSRNNSDDKDQNHKITNFTTIKLKKIPVKKAFKGDLGTILPRQRGISGKKIAYSILKSIYPP